MSRFAKALRLWLPFAVLGTALLLFAYVGIQQDLRMSANDPQIQMAEDAAAALAAGASPQSVASRQPVDLAASLSTFVIVSEDPARPIVNTARLGSAQPVPPRGAFDAAKAHGENRITWQPRPGVRLATVIVHYDGPHPGYVVVGRSLREVENRVDNLTKMAGLDYLGLLIGTFLVLLVIA